jgi:hypothetical protein
MTTHRWTNPKSALDFLDMYKGKLLPEQILEIDKYVMSLAINSWRGSDTPNKKLIKLAHAYLYFRVKAGLIK